MAASMTVDQIAELIGCAAPPQGGRRIITGVAALECAASCDLAYLSSDRYLKDFQSTQAGAVIVQQRVKLPPDERNTAVLVVDDAELALAKVLTALAPPIPRPPIGIDPTARIASTVMMGEDVAIGPQVVLGERAHIGSGTILHAGVFIGDDAKVGDHCELFPGVVVRERIILGHRVIIHSGSVLGSDGFGYRWDGSGHVKIPQIGTVIIGDDVEIGSCVCIDRAKFGATKIGGGSKIDNLVQIAHNVEVGEHCIIVGQAGIAGSAKLGRGVVLGGQVAVRDHIVIGDGAMVAATSGIAEDVPAKSIVSGTPALPHRQSLREQAALRDLPDLRNRVKQLKDQVDELQKKIDERS
jgi:UDP-3-O-[3-hydroxymyristoyl] glucosamine N-acyltransferase